MKHRHDWVDYGKGIGIILVVYAHLLSSGLHAGLPINPSFFAFSDSLVYSFHMPLFFFLAGLFAEQSYAERGLRNFVFDKVKKLFYPYLVWSFLQAGVEFAFAGHSFRGAELSRFFAIPWLPWAQFWFLYALLLMYVCYGLVRQLPLRLVPGVLLVTGCGVFFFPLESEFFAAHGFSTGFLFFIFGTLAKQYVERVDCSFPPLWVSCALLALFACAGWYVFARLIPPTRLTDGSHPWYFLGLALAGGAASLGLSRFLAVRGRLQPLRHLGRYSLQIYLVHMLAGVAARIFLERVLHVTNPFVHMLVGVAAGLYVPILLYTLCLRFGFPYLFSLSMSRESGWGDNRLNETT